MLVGRLKFDSNLIIILVIILQIDLISNKMGRLDPAPFKESSLPCILMRGGISTARVRRTVAARIAPCPPKTGACPRVIS